MSTDSPINVADESAPSPPMSSSTKTATPACSLSIVKLDCGSEEEAVLWEGIVDVLETTLGFWTAKTPCRLRLSTSHQLIAIPDPTDMGTTFQAPETIAVKSAAKPLVRLDLRRRRLELHTKVIDHAFTDEPNEHLIQLLPSGKYHPEKDAKDALEGFLDDTAAPTTFQFHVRSQEEFDRWVQLLTEALTVPNLSADTLVSLPSPTPASTASQDLSLPAAVDGVDCPELPRVTKQQDMRDSIVPAVAESAGSLPKTCKSQKLTFQGAVHILLRLRKWIPASVHERKTRAAINIQRVYRGYRARVQFRSKRRHIVTIQALMRRRTARQLLRQLKHNAVVQKHQPHRTRVMMEIYATEQSYVKNLDLAVHVFLKPMRALSKKAGVTTEQIQCIFLNLEEIWKRHGEFSAVLQPVVDQWSETTSIGEHFLKMAEWLTIYTPYCNNYDDAKHTLDKLKKIPAFQSFLDTTEGVKKLKRLDLSSFLILPVQRIPRYELLLKDMLKHTWSDHPDYANLQLALAAIKEAAKHLDRSKSFNQSRDQIIQLKQHLQNSGGGSHRISLPSIHSSVLSLSKFAGASSERRISNAQLEQRYIGEGPLLYYKPAVNLSRSVDSEPDGPPKEEPRQVYAYLFTDVLLLTKKSKPSATDHALNRVLGLTRNNSKGSKNQHYANIPLDRATLDPCPGEKRRDAIHRFLLRTADRKVHEFLTETVTAKNRWLMDLEEAIDTCKTSSSSLRTGASEFEFFSVDAEQQHQQETMANKKEESDEDGAPLIVGRKKSMMPSETGKSVTSLVLPSDSRHSLMFRSAEGLDALFRSSSIRSTKLVSPRKMASLLLSRKSSK